MASDVAQERLSYINTLYKEEDAERDQLAAKLQKLGIEMPEKKQLPFERVYFNGDMLAKYEPCMEALQNVIDADGEDDDAFASFERHFGKFMDFSWCSNWNGKRYDLVVYGCSGYTGFMTMEYLKRVAFKRTPEKFTVAFAGRSPQKVAEMRDRVLKGTQWEDTPIIQASYDDPVSMIDLARSARCLYNVAGPYMQTPGEIMIDACCFAGTHYVDINGEIPWMHRTCELHERAKDCNTIICPAAAVAGGYPDILLSLCAKQIREDYGEELKSCCCYWIGGGTGGGSSGGTLASRGGMASAGDWVRKLMADPFALSGFIPERDRNGLKEVKIQQGTGEATLKVRKEDGDAVLAKISEDPVNKCWRAPQLYAYFDTRIVRRTNALRADYFGMPYGRAFNFTEHTYIGAAEASADPLLAKVSGSGGAQGEKEMLEKAGKYYKQGEGPPLEDLEDCWLGLMLYVESVNGHVARNSAIGRDGYFETARMAVETALALVFDYDQLPIKGGCVTVASIGSEHIFKRLLNSGIKFKQGAWMSPEECGPPPLL